MNNWAVDENYILGCDTLQSSKTLLTFLGTHCLHLQRQKVSSAIKPTKHKLSEYLTLKMDAVYYSKVLVNFYETAICHIPHLHSHCHEDIISKKWNDVRSSW
jgi:hypothetical protein